MRKIILSLLIALAACASKPAPKDAVFEFIKAVRESDTTRVTQLLDIEAYIRSRMGEMSPADSAAVLSAYRDTTMQELLGPGEARERWVNWQIVVNRETKHDGMAEVEVSFVNRMSGYQLYTQIQLARQPDDAWRIVYFR